MIVAETFGKDHKHVLRDIEQLDCSDDFRESNFGLSSYKSVQNKELPKYIITQYGFSFLVMGYTGKEAARFKEMYIAEFNRMRKELNKAPQTILCAGLPPETDDGLSPYGIWITADLQKGAIEMNQLTILNQNGQLLVDSREVAEMTDKQHNNLLRNIEGFKAILDQNSSLSSDAFFIESSYEKRQSAAYGSLTPGMVAAKTTLPVIGVPVQSKALNGMDLLLSIVQMPAGVPVATVAIDRTGAVNAGLLAAQIIGALEPEVARRVQQRREATQREVLESSENL